MRRPTQEALKEQKQLLSRLEADWGRVNRPQVSKELRDSLHTRIVEVRACVATMEAHLRRAARKQAVAAG